MKIKHDFVTNSSSTAYVVIIPSKFTMSREEIIELYNSVVVSNGLDGDLSEDKVYETVTTYINKLKRSSNIHIYYWFKSIN